MQGDPTGVNKRFPFMAGAALAASQSSLIILRDANIETNGGRKKLRGVTFSYLAERLHAQKAKKEKGMTMKSTPRQAQQAVICEDACTPTKNTTKM